MPSYSKFLRPNTGGQTQDNPGNYFGNGSLGDVTISSNTTLATANDDAAIYESHFNNLTINSGVTLSLGFRRRAHVIYIKNNLIWVNGNSLTWEDYEKDIYEKELG